MNIKINWSDCLEKMACAMFSGSKRRTDPFETECTVTGSPVMAGWLKQYFLYDYPDKYDAQRVLACWDFKMLHPFVNDWLAKASSDTPVGKRDPTHHPYSPDALQWRIWNELCRGTAPEEFAALIDYIGEDPKAVAGKRWGLTRHLAQLLDDYQNYRPDLLMQWAKGNRAGLEKHPHLSWQAVLWRQLVADEPETYLKQFLNMRETLPACGISETYRRVTVFHTSAMPLAYMQFFVELGRIMPVEMFLFNPSEEFWIEDSTAKQHLRELIENGEDLAWMTPPHPILSGFGRGTQALLGTVLDVPDAVIHDQMRGENKNETLLQIVQADIRRRGNADNRTTALENAKDDGSIQFHICHGPMREVEVARDLIFRWFAQNPGSQPRDVQVLVTDMETYAPFVESVFRVTDHNPPIPCSISRRPAVSAGAAGAAFVRLMQFNESRMSAPETIELLELEPVRERYNLEADEVSDIRNLVNTAGIRWGRDGNHIAKALDTDKDSLPDTVTWRRGLDRLIAGFAFGRCADDNNMITAGELGGLHVCAEVEGNTAELVSKLAQFYEDLCVTADDISANETRRVSSWAGFYTAMLERFFRGTENSFAELAEIRKGIKAVADAAEVSGDPEVPAEIAAAAIEAQLGGVAPAGKADINAVLFSPLHTMQVTPRKLIIMLGLNEGTFPRADQRPAFDLLAIKPRYGDRSLRYEDRLAFLEAIMSARERLIITYTGRNISNNKEIPPSPAVTELQQYLNTFTRDDSLIKPVEHKLHGFNPDYYSTDQAGRLFSYSRSNHAAAKILAGIPDSPYAITAASTGGQAAALEDSSAGGTAEPDGKKQVTLETIQDFFENPAKHFYTNILKIRLTDPARGDVSESEMFDGDKLDEYKINDIMLKHILAKSGTGEKADFEPDDDYYKHLQEQALIPLGTFGLGKTREQLNALKEFLNSQKIPDHQSSLYQSLLNLETAKANPNQIRATFSQHEISANLPILACPRDNADNRVLLCFRNSSIKPKDRLRAWLAHLAGHAAGDCFETIIAGNKKGEIEVNIIPPVARHLAEERLAAILALYEEGCTELIPFAPKTAHAYAEQIRKDDDEVKADEKAIETWGGYIFPENNDLYLFDAWGEAGPMTHSDFADNTMTFWNEFPFPSADKAKATPAPADPEESHD